MIDRTVNPLKNKSFFLFGPRQTGKSTYVKQMLEPQDLYINLLPQRTFTLYLKDVGLFRQEVLSHQASHPHFRCVVDEVQKIPALLDEVHDLIESHSIGFILTGSSARKLKRGAANLLAGRALTYQLYPLTFEELGTNFNLEKVLQVGGLPYLWSQPRTLEETEEFLRSYAETYLKEEIQSEGLVRQVGPFVRFLDIAAHNDGEVVNFSNIARECGVSVKTVQEYYQILEDTFIAYRIDPWLKSVRKRLVAHPRYYFFDTGVTNALCQQLRGLNSVSRGRRFEQWIVTQIVALNAYHRWGVQLHFWRTSTGVEVDLLLAKNGVPICAIEIKSGLSITQQDAAHLLQLKEDYPHLQTFIVSTHERPRLLENGVMVLPVKELFQLLPTLL